MSEKETIRRLMDVCGQTYANQAGIELTDKPAPLYRLLVLSVLLSTRIKADIAVAASRELTAAGFGTAQKMRDADWQQRVDALGKAHYKRYDEQTASALGDGAQLLLDEYSGDLRKLRQRADGSTRQLRDLLAQVPRLGPVGADIFSREAQLIWPELRPYLDKKALDGARKLGVSTDAHTLARQVSDQRLATLAAALVRVSLDPKLIDEVQ